MFLVIATTVAVSVTFADTRAVTDGLTPSVKHRQTTSLITKLMARYHYKKAPLDDRQSALVLERYLQNLDPNRSFFLRADVESFSRYRHRFDDHLRSATVEPAFAIFRVFQQRLDERVAYAKSLLQQRFDFTLDETHVFDRSDESWADNLAELNDIWRRRVKNDILTLRLSGKAEEEILGTLGDRYDRLAKRNRQLEADDVYGLFINAYTSSVEPHTAYFSPRTSENFKIRMSLSLEGIGAVLQRDNDHTLIRSIVPGGPAALSQQLHAGDRITGVGQGVDEEVVDVIGWRLDDVVDMIRGPKGTVVRLEVLPKGEAPGGRTSLITLVRNRIDLEEQAAQKAITEVRTDHYALRIGILDVPTFYSDFGARSRGERDYRSTTRDVRRLLEELIAEEVDGVVVDLRGNGGGSLTEVTELTGLFIDTGPIVQVRGSNGEIEIKRDTEPGMIYSGPLAVLVDRHSASASEIFAGAIQDYDRGIVIGEPTFGKGTVQTLIDLDRFMRGDDNDHLGQLKVTIAQFFRVNGESTQNRGVVPDVVFPTIADSEEHGERALEHALPWASVRPANFRQTSGVSEHLGYARLRHRDRVEVDPALALLAERAAFLRESMERNAVTLNEAKRRAERESDDRRRNDLEARFLSIHGVEAVERLADGEETPPGDEDVNASEELAGELLSREAAHILADMIFADRKANPPRVRTASTY